MPAIRTERFAGVARSYNLLPATMTRSDDDVWKNLAD